MTQARYNNNGGAFFCGSTQSGNPNTPKDNTAYDGLIVRTPWRYKPQPEGAFAVNVNRATKPGQAIDGLSNTLLIAEKLVNSTSYASPIGTYSDDYGWSDGWDPDVMRLTAFQPMNDADPICQATNVRFCGPNGAGGDSDVWQFGSAHTTGINAVFGDGSVRQIAYTVDVILFNNLGGKSDGEVIDASQL